MPTAIPIAYNPSLSPISGTTQVGVFATGFPVTGFTGEPRWWNSADSDPGYIVGYPVADGNVPTPNSGETAYVTFYRASARTDNAFISLANYITGLNFPTPSSARSWLVNNIGCYTDYPSSGISVNDFYQGGIVGYIFVPGQPRYVSGETHGIIIDINNFGTQMQNGDPGIGPNYQWGCSGSTTGSTTIIGSGLTAQQIICADQTARCPTYFTGCCFYFATGYTLGGYTDWFVGNFDEYSAVFSGTGNPSFNLPNYSGWSEDNNVQAYYSSEQFSTTNFWGAIRTSTAPNYNTYPPSKFGALKTASTANVKLLRYF